MQIEITRPVTLLSVRHAQRWFPFLFQHTDGSILLYIEHGYDAHFAPVHRLRSIDGGKAWQEEEENVPRLCWAMSFADNELLEIDSYGIQDPCDATAFNYYGVWSVPGSPTTPLQRFTSRIVAPSCRPVAISSFQKESPYPTFPWWPLINQLHRKSEVAGDEIFVGGPYLTSGVQHGESILAIGYALHRDEQTHGTSVFIFKSNDRGRNWEEIALVARGNSDYRGVETPEGFNESSLVRLRNGELYAVMRGGDRLFHCWSQDDGLSWSEPEPIRLIDSDFLPRRVWPICRVLHDGSLVLAFGRPGKYLIFDPSGTGTQWQRCVDLHAWETETQEFMGVPAEMRLHGDTDHCERYWDSSDYLACIETSPGELLVAYDVQNYHENWNSIPVAAVRAVRLNIKT